jgi:hypothetical protein
MVDDNFHKDRISLSVCCPMQHRKDFAHINTSACTMHPTPSSIRRVGVMCGTCVRSASEASVACVRTPNHDYGVKTCLFVCLFGVTVNTDKHLTKHHHSKLRIKLRIKEHTFGEYATGGGSAHRCSADGMLQTKYWDVEGAFGGQAVVGPRPPAKIR